tara:strand:+ start:1243 stop:2007 length:765 start_codon:yes stop_codon:yes gene_type:complete
MDKLSLNLDIALAVVKEAASAISKNFLSYRKLKQDIGREVKIEADFKLNQIIVQLIKKKSSFNIISEEISGNTIIGNEYSWILDPLDGSFNYLRGLPTYCISLALWKGYEPRLGVIYDLMHDDIYFGIIGKNAFKNNNKITVSNVSKQSEAVLCTGFPVNFLYSRNNIDNFVSNVLKYKKIRLLGSAAMSLSYVASGVVDAYIEKDIMVWDVAAGIAIVEAAGGVVDFASGSKKNSLTVKASNNLLQKKRNNNE